MKRRRRDTDLSAELIAKHWDRVYRVHFLVSRDRETAEDLTQETMLKALRGAESFDRSRPLTPWINRITSNVARDWLRTQSRQRTEPLESEPTGAGADELADRLAEASLAPQLADALMDLSLEHRTVVVLRHLLDMSPAEIAEALELNPTTVRTRLHRGVLQLRKTLNAEEAEHADAAR